MMAVSEEKVLSDLENSFSKEKVNDVEDEPTTSDDVKTDAMLDEIAAKVDSLDFNKVENDDDDDSGDVDELHAKCMETVKKQGETINTLVQQLRVMFDEYQAVDQEREYYEELNDALIRCLEISEGKINFESESEREVVEEEENKTIDKEENIKNLIEKEEEQVEEIKQKDENNTKDDNKLSDVNNNDVEASSSNNNEKPQVNDENDNESTASECNNQILNHSELIRLNRVLLREIFELRHQIDVMKENIHEYLNSDSEGSEYDTATDDEDPDHSCEHCSPSHPSQAPAVNGEDKVEDESYEILENENEAKIADEPDTE